MTTLKFKTNVNCRHCISSITPFLNELKSVEKWEVDIEDADKILTVSGENITPEMIQNALIKAGYNSSINI